MTAANPFAGLMTKEEFGAALPKKRTKRTIDRWIAAPDGLPTIRIGNQEFIDPPTAFHWALKRMKQRNPRRRGRSSSKAA